MPSKTKVMVIFGTRPEALKCFPVIHEMKKRSDIEVSVCVTGQHRKILDQVLNLVNLIPDIDLNLMRKRPTLTDVTTDVLQRIGEVLDEVKPDRILVQGDTTTAMAAALAAFYRKIPIGHIEAGLRSNNIYSPWPEEANRRIISVMADMNFAPTEQARANLLEENIAESNILVTGNTVIDALFSIKKRLDETVIAPPELTGLISERDKRRIILVTSHRRENWGDGILQICAALKSLAGQDDVHLIYPVHPNPNVLGPVQRELSGVQNISLIEPVDYLPFIYLMNKSYFILSDSGGVQEEAPALGKPVLVLRDTTERPEGIIAGAAKLVGTDTKTIVEESLRLLNDRAHYEKMSQVTNPYGDGKASNRIVEHILNV